MRKHPAVLLAPVAWGPRTDRRRSAQHHLVPAQLYAHLDHLAPGGLVFLRLLWAAANWSVDYFVITSRRFIETNRPQTVDPRQRPSATIVQRVHTEEVTGSIPVSPTSVLAGQPRFRLGAYSFRASDVPGRQ